MIIYLLVFAISFLFAYLAEKESNKGRKVGFYILSFISIAIPSLMAGLRASGIGTDTKVYIDWIFKESVYTNNISDFMSFINLNKTEPLYCLINFIVARFSNNLSVIYFVLEFLFLFFSYFGCVKMSKKLNISSSFCYLVLLLLFFNKSLNMCRQSLAMALCLFSLSYIIDRKLLKFLLCMLIGYGFHKSIILFVPLYFIYGICIKNTKRNFLIKLLIISGILAIILLFKKLMLFFISMGLLNSKYVNFIYLFGDTYNIKSIELLSELAILLITIVFKRNLVSKSKYNSFLIYIILLSFTTFLFGFNASYSQRISYYYSMVLPLIIPQFIEIFKIKKDRLLASIVIILVLCGYFYLYYDKYKFDQTIPYKMDISINKIIN